MQGIITTLSACRAERLRILIFVHQEKLKMKCRAI